MFPARDAQAVGGFPEAAGGDLLLGQGLAQRGLRARHLPDYLVSCAHALPAPCSLRNGRTRRHSAQAVRGLRISCMTPVQAGAWGLTGCDASAFCPAQERTGGLPRCAGRCAEAGRGSCAGEAPEEGSAFRAGARRCQACLQQFLSRACPLFARGLPLGARALALGDALHYVAAALCVPAALAVPLATALTRALPLLLTWQWLAAAVPYLALTLAGAFAPQKLAPVLDYAIITGVTRTAVNLAGRCVSCAEISICRPSLRAPWMRGQHGTSTVWLHAGNWCSC